MLVVSRSAVRSVVPPSTTALLFLPLSLALAGGCAPSLSTGPAVPGVRDGVAARSAEESAARRTEVTLDNGLHLVLEENHAAPVVAMQAWVKVGSADDPDASPGMAHFFEHLLLWGPSSVGQRGGQPRKPRASSPLIRRTLRWGRSVAWNILERIS